MCVIFVRVFINPFKTGPEYIQAWVYGKCMLLQNQINLSFFIAPTLTQITNQLTSPTSDLKDHNASRAFSAASSKIGSPVSLLRVPNSTMNVPIPAVHDTAVSPLGTPWN